MWAASTKAWCLSSLPFVLKYGNLHALNLSRIKTIAGFQTATKRAYISRALSSSMPFILPPMNAFEVAHYCPRPPKWKFWGFILLESFQVTTHVTIFQRAAALCRCTWEKTLLFNRALGIPNQHQAINPAGIVVQLWLCFYNCKCFTVGKSSRTDWMRMYLINPSPLAFNGDQVEVSIPRKLWGDYGKLPLWPWNLLPLIWKVCNCLGQLPRVDYLQISKPPRASRLFSRELGTNDWTQRRGHL